LKHDGLDQCDPANYRGGRYEEDDEFAKEQCFLFGVKELRCYSHTLIEDESIDISATKMLILNTKFRPLNHNDMNYTTVSRGF